MIKYDDYLKAKIKAIQPAGFDAYPLTAALFNWQAQIVRWAIKQGRSAMLCDCGLGKTPMQLEWGNQIVIHTGKPVLCLTPLAVSRQTEREGHKFGIMATVAESQDDVIDNRIWITNYEKLERFDPSMFSGVILDESSILKNFTGKTRKSLTDAFRGTGYKLCCTATPSPNDYTELGQHADFLGVCSPAQMLATFFINDTFNTGDWRLKKHAEKAFWMWLSSWAAVLAKPSDIGYSDEGYILPKLDMRVDTVQVDETAFDEGQLFKHSTFSATTMHREMRETSDARCARAADIVAATDEACIIWCNTNDEADKLVKMIPSAVEVRGSDTNKAKEKRLDDFSAGRSRVIITKPGIAGYGLNWQHCHNVIFVGLSYSFEDFYQALRRSYRFGQVNQVIAWIIQASTEGPILKSIKEKIEQHRVMQESMKAASECFAENQVKELRMKTEIDIKNGDGWTMNHGDCVRVAQTIADETIDLAVFSPPFADLFTYSDDLQDMGNCDSMQGFMQHFDYLVAELKRIMVPGREVAVHCVDLLSTKWKHGKIEFQDFSGEIIRMFWRHGFTFHSRICIWKSPVTEMQRTKAHGLLYKTLCSDSTDCRVGCADYLIVFRKPGDNPRPVVKDKTQYPVDWWQEVASPVWMTVNQGNVLNGREAKSEKDERHICPLQLDVVERAVSLWSNPGDLVFSPFAGIGSEGYQALKMGRKFIGAELKESYFKIACRNMTNAKAQMELFV